MGGGGNWEAEVGGVHVLGEEGEEQGGRVDGGRGGGGRQEHTLGEVLVG